MSTSLMSTDIDVHNISEERLAQLSIETAAKIPNLAMHGESFRAATLLCDFRIITLELLRRHEERKLEDTKAIK